MLGLFLLFLNLLHSVHSSTCPSGFELVKEGECRGYLSYNTYYYNETVDNVMAKCATVQAQMITIHDSEHQTYYASHRMYYAPLGLLCNTTSKLWEWVDGSILDYKPSTYDSQLDSECSSGCVWTITDMQRWQFWCGHSQTSYFDNWCAVTIPPSTKECDNFNDDNEDSACYQIGATVENWQDAEMECRNFGADLASIHNEQENTFIRRLAVSKGTVNGVFLEATITGKGTGYGWIDGTEWNYENFYPGFPIDGLGDCVAMDTLGTTGQWMNMDCNNKLAVACVRQPNTSYTDTCSSGPWKEGQIIYSPGYPYDASLPCEYFLTVDAGKKVEVKIQSLEANTCCDHLILTDSYLGGNIVANLTGEISSKTYTTKSSNLMRVSWQPNGGVNVKGFMMTYRGV